MPQNIRPAPRDLRSHSHVRSAASSLQETNLLYSSILRFHPIACYFFAHPSLSCLNETAFVLNVHSPVIMVCRKSGFKGFQFSLHCTYLLEIVIPADSKQTAVDVLVQHMLQPETCAKENFKFGGNRVSLKTAGQLYLQLLHDWLLPFVKQSINHAPHYDEDSLPIIATVGNSIHRQRSLHSFHFYFDETNIFSFDTSFAKLVFL